MLNDSLARSSELFMYIAALIYTVVFIAFTSDVVANSRVTRRLEGRSEGTAQKPSVKAKIKVGAGAVSGASATANTAADTVRTGGTEQGTGERGMGYKGAAARALEGEAQRVPWGNMYEFCTTGALMVSAVFLITLIFRDVRFVGTLVSGLVLIMLCAATIGFPTPVGHLKPALQSYWLVIHVSIAVLASGVFTITFAMAVLQLVQTRREQRILNGKSGGWAVMRLVPSAQALENFAFRMNALAFVMWTFTLAAGAIWANHAWGRYWGWDTKEVWTFVIWVVYAAYLHARATRGWAGPRSAWLSIIGYACIIFNFTVVNIFFSGLHSYSGL